MAIVLLPASPLAPGVSPVHIRYRDVGAGRPLVILHGGWGYEIYPFDRQIAALLPSHRIVIPDRTGYGGSGRLERQEIDFHQRAADETLEVIEALALDRPAVWGHSDGAVIALRMAMAAPERLAGVIVEAAHFFRSKPASREFFGTMMDDPDSLGERVTSVLAREHGQQWREVIRAGGAAWNRIADERPTPDADLYDGRLTALRVPALVIHGARDPRTEPGELQALRAALSRANPSNGAPTQGAQFAIVEEGAHSPHSERAAADEVTRLAAAFLAGLDHPAPPAQAASRALTAPPAPPAPGNPQ